MAETFSGTAEASTVRVDAVVIRQILEAEINSKIKSVDRLVKAASLDAAAREDAVREGVSWALFVLAQRLGV